MERKRLRCTRPHTGRRQGRHEWVHRRWGWLPLLALSHGKMARDRQAKSQTAVDAGRRASARSGRRGKPRHDRSTADLVERVLVHEQRRALRLCLGSAMRQVQGECRHWLVERLTRGPPHPQLLQLHSQPVSGAADSDVQPQQLLVLELHTAVLHAQRLERGHPLGDFSFFRERLLGGERGWAGGRVGRLLLG